MDGDSHLLGFWSFYANNVIDYSIVQSRQVNAEFGNQQLALNWYNEGASVFIAHNMSEPASNAAYEQKLFDGIACNDGSWYPKLESESSLIYKDLP